VKVSGGRSVTGPQGGNAGQLRESDQLVVDADDDSNRGRRILRLARLPPMTRQFSRHGTHLFHVLARGAGVAVILIGLTALAGWLLDSPVLKAVLPGAVEMKANTAVGLLLAGFALCLLDAPPSSQRSRIGQVLALLVSALGIATLGEYVFGWQLGIDELLFRDTTDAFNPFRGRMSPYSAVVFATIGLGLAALPMRSLRWFGWLATTLTLLIGGSSLIGYLWYATELVTDRYLPPVAVNTAVAFILLGFGTLMAGREPAPQTSGVVVPLSSVEIRSLVGFLATFVLLLAAGGLTYRATVATTESARRVAHTQQVRANLGRLYATVSDAESQHRNYLLSTSPDYLEDFNRYAGEATNQTAALARLVADNPAQTKNAKELQAVVRERLTLLQSTTATFEQSGLAAAQDSIRNGEGRKLMEAIRALITEMDSAEEELLTAREVGAAHDKALTLLFLLVTLAIAVVGFVVLFGGIRREMTTRTQAEEALRRSEENLAVTLHSIGDAVLATDAQRRITRLNPVAEKLTGWTQAEAVGRLVDEVFRIINEDTRQPSLIPVDAVLATGEIQGLANHTALVARDGTECPIADSAAPIRDKSGTILGVVLVFRDVSAERAAQKALRESEARYRTLFDSIDEGFCIIEMIFDEKEKPVDYRFLEINPSFAKQSGIRDGLGRRILELVPQIEGYWLETFGRIALTGEPARIQNRVEQLQRTYDVYAFRFGAPKNHQVAILFNDITERKQAEEQIAQLNADLQNRATQLEAANKELESFSYSVSHDLRAPLRSIDGFSRILQEDYRDKLDAAGWQHTERIRAAALRMSQLIDDMLTLSRVTRAELHRLPFDLSTVAQAVIAELRAAAPSRQVEFVATPGLSVSADKQLLVVVLENLLGNAWKFTSKKDGARIEFGVLPGGYTFFVADNGAGFDMAYAGKLFGAFQRLHATSDFPGTGIGLASVQRIIHRHGGRVWAEGAVDGGAKFYFTLGKEN